MAIKFNEKARDEMTLVVDKAMRSARTMVIYVGDKEVTRTPVKFEHGCFVALESLTIDDPNNSRYEIINRAGDVLLAGDEWAFDGEINIDTVPITPSMTISIN